MPVPVLKGSTIHTGCISPAVLSSTAQSKALLQAGAGAGDMCEVLTRQGLSSKEKRAEPASW